MRAIPDWSLDHADIAGGIIQTPAGDYEVTRVIGEPTEFEAVRADLRMMAAAPTLLRAALGLLAVVRAAPAGSFEKLPASLAEEMRKFYCELATAVASVERSGRGNGGAPEAARAED